MRVSLEGCGGGRRGNLTLLRWLLLLQHLGLVGATGPHSGSKGEYHSPLVQLGMRARRQAHIGQQVRSRGDENDGCLVPFRPNLLLIDFTFVKFCALISKPVFWSQRSALARLLAGGSESVQSRRRYLVETRAIGSGSRSRHYHSEHQTITQHASPSACGAIGPHN